MSDNRDFDPRFSPAFQRGFEGPADAAAPASVPTAPAKPTVIGAPPARAVQPESPVVARAAASSSAFFDDAAAHEPALDVDTDRRINPFVIALAAAAVLLVGGGLVLLSRLRDLYADTQSDFDYVTLQVMMIAAPLLVCLGLATGLGLLFFFAARRAR